MKDSCTGFGAECPGRGLVEGGRAVVLGRDVGSPWKDSETGGGGGAGIKEEGGGGGVGNVIYIMLSVARAGGSGLWVCFCRRF